MIDVQTGIIGSTGTIEGSRLARGIRHTFFGFGVTNKPFPAGVIFTARAVESSGSTGGRLADIALAN